MAARVPDHCEVGAFPPVLWAMLRKPNLTLLCSALLYFAARNFGWNLPAFRGLVLQSIHMAVFVCLWRLVCVGWINDVDADHSIPNSLAFALLITMAGRFPELRELLPVSVYDAFNPNDKTNLAPYRLIVGTAWASLVLRRSTGRAKKGENG